MILICDNGRDIFPVIGIADYKTVLPGKHYALVIRADGSQQWISTSHLHPIGHKPMIYDNPLPETDAAKTARLLAKERGEPVLIINYRNVRGEAVPAKGFSPRNYENCRVVAIGYPPDWKYAKN